MAEAIASSELERASALYDEAVRVENSYRAYSEELLAAWGLGLTGAPLADSGAAAGGGSGYRASAREPREEEKDGGSAQKTSDAALLRDQLGRIPGLTGENRAAMVRDYYANGRISYDEMQELLAGL